MKLDDSKLYLIIGGANMSGSILNACSTLIKTVYSIGQGLGGAIRRIITGNVCRI